LALTPGDGNPQANAKGRVYSKDASGGEQIQVADLRSCTFNALMIISLCMGNPEPKPDIKTYNPPTVTIQIGPNPKKKIKGVRPRRGSHGRAPPRRVKDGAAQSCT
jgi:hypothetical protein